MHKVTWDILRKLRFRNIKQFFMCEVTDQFLLFFLPVVSFHPKLKHMAESTPKATSHLIKKKK